MLRAPNQAIPKSVDRPGILSCQAIANSTAAKATSDATAARLLETAECIEVGILRGGASARCLDANITDHEAGSIAEQHQSRSGLSRWGACIDVKSCRGTARRKTEITAGRKVVHTTIPQMMRPV